MLLSISLLLIANVHVISSLTTRWLGCSFLFGVQLAKFFYALWMTLHPPLSKINMLFYTKQSYALVFILYMIVMMNLLFVRNEIEA